MKFARHSTSLLSNVSNLEDDWYVIITVDIIESTSIYFEPEASYLYYNEPLALENKYNKTIMLHLDLVFFPLDDSFLGPVAQTWF